MQFDYSKFFVTKFALKFTEFQKFQPLTRPSATEGEAEGEKPLTSAEDLWPSVDHCFICHSIESSALVLILKPI